MTCNRVVLSQVMSSSNQDYDALQLRRVYVFATFCQRAGVVCHCAWKSRCHPLSHTCVPSLASSLPMPSRNPSPYQRILIRLYTHLYHTPVYRAPTFKPFWTVLCYAIIDVSYTYRYMHNPYLQRRSRKMAFAASPYTNFGGESTALAVVDGYTFGNGTRMEL